MTPHSLDAAVAERVMGRHPNRPCPAYSSDIAAAWQVVDEMKHRGFCLVLEEHWIGATWSACFISEGMVHGDGESWGTSPAWCICSAAIAALEGKEAASDAS